MPKRKEQFVGGFVAVTFEMMDHKSFRILSEAAIRVFLHCLRKAYGPDRYRQIFKFTYPEAQNRLAISASTFRRAMQQLHSMGFIDYYSPGGRRGSDNPDPKGYQLSLRWKKFGTSDFEKRHEGYYESLHG